MSGGDKQGCGILIMVVVVIAFGMVLGLLKSITEHPWLIAVIALAVVVFFLGRMDKARINRNSEQSRSQRRPQGK